MSKEIFVMKEGKFIVKSINGVLTDEYLKIDSGRSNPFSGYGSDGLGGINGIINHADGKRYDSKSNYNRAVVASGCRVVGNDYNNVTYKTPLERGVRGDFNCRPQLKEAVQRVLNK